MHLCGQVSFSKIIFMEFIFPPLFPSISSSASHLVVQDLIDQANHLLSTYIG